jgi:pimeloyl-ACP methyl ester carboxylesterase
VRAVHAGERIPHHRHLGHLRGGDSSCLPDVPTLLLSCERDLSTPIEWLRQEAKVAAGVEVVIVSAAAHAVQTRALPNHPRNR